MPTSVFVAATMLPSPGFVLATMSSSKRLILSVVTPTLIVVEAIIPLPSVADAIISTSPSAPFLTSTLPYESTVAIFSLLVDHLTTLRVAFAGITSADTVVVPPGVTCLSLANTLIPDTFTA